MTATDRQLTGEAILSAAFHDADPAGVVWHGNYFKYFDFARCNLLDRIDYGYRAMAASGYVWPVVDARLRYVKAIGYDDPITVTARLVEWEYRLKMIYEIRGSEGDLRTTGYTIQVAVQMATGQMCYEVPEFLRRRIDRLLDG